MFPPGMMGNYTYIYIYIYYVPQHPILDALLAYVLFLICDTKLDTHTKQQTNLQIDE